MKLAPHLPVKYGFQQIIPPPIPEAEKHVGHFFKSFDARLWLFYRLWEPEQQQQQQNNEIKATLMILHGTIDHSGVYEELAKALNQIGVAVIAMDMRGWGLSDGESMYFNDTDTFVEDLNTLYTRIHDDPRYENVGHRFLMGKSLGGLITAYAIEKYPTNWTGLIGLSGAYSLDSTMIMSPIIVIILKILAFCIPKLPIKPLFDESLIVADEDALEQWRNDKLCCKDWLRIGYGVELFRAVDALPASLSNATKLPMLMMIGRDDKVVTLEGHQLMIALHQCTDKKLKVYPGGRHNLLQEPKLKHVVIQDNCEWIRRHTVVDGGCGCERLDY